MKRSSLRMCFVVFFVCFQVFCCVYQCCSVILVSFSFRVFQCVFWCVFLSFGSGDSGCFSCVLLCLFCFNDFFAYFLVFGMISGVLFCLMAFSYFFWNVWGFFRVIGCLNVFCFVFLCLNEFHGVFRKVLYYWSVLV